MLISFYFSIDLAIIYRLIHLAQKNLYIVIGLIAALVVLSILNILGALDYFSTSSEQVDKIVDLTIIGRFNSCIDTIGFTFTKNQEMFLIDGLICLKEILLIATMGIAMTARTKEEAIFGLSQSIQEISKLLQEYIDSKIILMNF